MNPRAILHLDAATPNQTIARRMLGHFDSGVTPNHDDWVITVTFYSALHLVDALLVEQFGHTPTNHRQRSYLVRVNPVLSHVAEEYRALKTASETATYQPVHTFPPDAVQQAFDQLDEIRDVVTAELDTE